MRLRDDKRKCTAVGLKTGLVHEGDGRRDPMRCPDCGREVRLMKTGVGKFWMIPYHHRGAV